MQSRRPRIPGRPILGDPKPYCPFGLVHTSFGPAAWLGIDEDASPTYAEVAEMRTERLAIVRKIVDALTSEEFDRVCAQNSSPGYPPQTQLRVRDALHVILSEEWQHNLYAKRDLAVLEAKQ